MVWKLVRVSGSTQGRARSLCLVLFAAPLQDCAARPGAGAQHADNSVNMRTAEYVCDGPTEYVCTELSTYLRLAKKCQFTALLNAFIAMIACVIGGSTGTLSLQSLGLKTLKGPAFALIAVIFDAVGIH